MPRVGFEPTISAGERPQTYALDRAATGTGGIKIHMHFYGELYMIINGLELWHTRRRRDAEISEPLYLTI